MTIQQRSFARAGLLGNPSDGYFGKTISISIRNFEAGVTLQESSELQIVPQSQDHYLFDSISHLTESVKSRGYYGGARLIKATIKTFHDYCAANSIEIHDRNFSISYSSTIPRQVGLAGSSAIITAALRALMQFYHVEIPLEIQPNLVLAAEVEELGIVAGLQDRVIQVFEGCVYMDFNRQQMADFKWGSYQHIDPVLLPRLYVAYITDLGKVSGRVLSDIQSRFEDGDQEVISKLERIAALAEEGKEAIERGDKERLHLLVNENFDIRSQIMHITSRNLELVERARDCGASAKFTGSGGAIIGTFTDDAMLDRLKAELRKAGASVIEPVIA